MKLKAPAPFCLLRLFSVHTVLSVLTISTLVGGASPAFAQQQSSTSSSSSFLSKLKDRTHLMYWSMVGGPRLGGPFDRSVDGAGAPMAPYFFNMLWTGAMVSMCDSVGVLNRLLYTFDRAQSSFAIRSPRLYWRHANAIDNSALNLGTEVRLEIPTTDALREMGNLSSVQLVQNFQIKTKDKNWFLGLSFIESGMLNRSRPNVLGIAAMPSASYTLSPQWSLYSWAWLDTDYRNDTGWTSAGTLADADYVRIGPMYSPSSSFQIYPCIQAYLFNLQAQTLTWGLELSATL